MLYIYLYTYLWDTNIFHLLLIEYLIKICIFNDVLRYLKKNNIIFTYILLFTTVLLLLLLFTTIFTTTILLLVLLLLSNNYFTNDLHKCVIYILKSTKQLIIIMHFININFIMYNI